MSAIPPFDDLLTALAGGSTVLTVNRRLQRTLAAAYDQHCRQLGMSAWARPALFTRDAWLREQVQRLPQPPLVLSAAQCHLLWEQIVRSDLGQTGHDLLQLPPTARSARAAAVLLDRYQAVFSDADAASDQQAFLRWQRAWQRQAAAQGWCDPDTLARPVAAALDAGALVPPGEVIFAGFDDLAPDDLQLRAALTERGCRCRDWQLPPLPAPRLRRAGCADPEAEVRLAARSVRALLQVQPQARIGVVVASMGAYQALLQTPFFAELDPTGWVAGQPRSPLVNVSLGQTLDRCAPVQAALRLLRLGHQVALDEISWLLRSPYLDGHLTERSARALCEVDLRARKLAQWPLPGLIRLLDGKGGGKGTLPRFNALLEARRQALRSNRRQSPGAWGEQLARELRDGGWPGDRPLCSDEFQAVQHLRDQLAALAGFDLVSPAVDRAGAVALLVSLCAETLFQPESGDAPVQVLGLLEAAGQRFDRLIVLGLHDGAFPAPANPNPFIPLPLQRKLRLPHADAQRERDYARHIAATLFAAAADILLSWPQQIDGTPRRPSPLLAAIDDLAPAPTAASAAADADADAAALVQRVAPPLETCDDRLAPPIHAQGAVSGGTGLIKDQALCPFRAFAHHRLRARGFDEVDLGFDGMDRGTLVHSVLELFWAQTGSQQALLALGAAALAERLDDCIEQALARFEKSRRCDLPPLPRRLEAQRLRRLAAAWLEIDAQRTPFTVSVEALQTEQVGPLQIRTRIDRIDTLTDGRQAIIDYKTGQVDPKVWLDARLTEPQLPIYCQNLAAGSVAAVLFASLRNGGRDCRFTGVAAEPDAWPGLKQSSQDKLFAGAGIADFTALLGGWKPALAALGEAFVAGAAEVAPTDKACRSCDLQPLCRIHEQAGVAAEDGEGA